MKIGALCTAFGTRHTLRQRQWVPKIELSDDRRGRPAESETRYKMDEKDLRQRLEELRLEHRDLDDVIGRLQEEPAVDQLQLTRLKKRKLWLKDMIAKIESKLTPDIIA